MTLEFVTNSIIIVLLCYHLYKIAQFETRLEEAEAHTSELSCLIDEVPNEIATALDALRTTFREGLQVEIDELKALITTRDKCKQANVPKEEPIVSDTKSDVADFLIEAASHIPKPTNKPNRRRKSKNV